VSVASTRWARFVGFISATVLARWQLFSAIILCTVLAGYIICNEELIKKIRSELARQGGLARAKSLTPKQRRESAIKASKAAAIARTRKARAKKQGGSKQS
jgi:hypothetical protein